LSSRTPSPTTAPPVQAATVKIRPMICIRTKNLPRAVGPGAGVHSVRPRECGQTEKHARWTSRSREASRISTGCVTWCLVSGPPSQRTSVRAADDECP
jgi:hypothetical protein